MKEVVEKIKEIDGIKSVRPQGEKLLKIKPFSKELKYQEEEKIIGDLRTITPKISNALDSVDTIDNWEWNIKPKKRYAETGISDCVSDRKAKGHKPAHYLVTIHWVD